MNWEHIICTAPIVAAIICIIWLLVYFLVWVIQILYVPKERERGMYEKPTRPEDKIYNKQPGEAYTDVRIINAYDSSKAETVRPAKFYRVVDGRIVKEDQ